MKAIYFDGNNGEKVRREADSGRAEGRSHRQPGSTCSKRLSMYSDELMELLLAEEDVPAGIDPHDRHATPCRRRTDARCSWARPIATRACSRCWTRSSAICPRRWIGRSRPRTATSPTRSSRSSPIPTKPFVGMAFKIVEDPFGQLTFMRIYQGTINKGEMLLQPAHRPEAALQPHRARCTPTSARKSTRASAGDIVAVMGIDCASGDTYASQNEVLHAGKHVRARAGHQDGDQRR